MRRHRTKLDRKRDVAHDVPKSGTKGVTKAERLLVERLCAELRLTPPSTVDKAADVFRIIIRGDNACKGRNATHERRKATAHSSGGIR